MKTLFLFLTIFFVLSHANGQNTLVRIDPQSGKFRNTEYLPCCSALTVEGEISKAIALVELKVFYKDSDKALNVSTWTRNVNNQSELYEIQLLEHLEPNTSYDFELRTFKLMTKDQKDNFKQNLLVRMHKYLKQNIEINGKKIKVDNPNRVFFELNNIIRSAIHYQRSLNGVKFEGLSDITKKELKDLNELSIKYVLKKKKRDEKYEVTSQLLEEKIADLVEMVYSEIYPFLASDLVQMEKLIEMKGINTEKTRSTIPINLGLYAFSSTEKINNISENNSGILPGAGVTIPFRRSFKVKKYTIGEMGLSLGLLFQPIETQGGQKLGLPGIGIPMYAGIGFKTLKIIRVNFGTLIATDLASPSRLKFMPTVGINLELNLWLGTKRY